MIAPTFKKRCPGGKNTTGGTRRFREPQLQLRTTLARCDEILETGELVRFARKEILAADLGNFSLRRHRLSLVEQQSPARTHLSVGRRRRAACRPAVRRGRAASAGSKAVVQTLTPGSDASPSGRPIAADTYPPRTRRARCKWALPRAREVPALPPELPHSMRRLSSICCRTSPTRAALTRRFVEIEHVPMGLAQVVGPSGRVLRSLRVACGRAWHRRQCRVSGHRGCGLRRR